MAVTKQEEFWEACGFGNTERVRKLIAEGIDVNWVSYTVCHKHGFVFSRVGIVCVCLICFIDDHSITSMHVINIACMVLSIQPSLSDSVTPHYEQYMNASSSSAHCELGGTAATSPLTFRPSDLPPLSLGANPSHSPFLL